MRLIDADALIDSTRNLRCIECERRNGMKNGKMKFVYEIGDAPCRACDVSDMIDALDEAPTVDVLALLKEQSERIMRESMGTIERRLAAVECQPIEIKSTDQMVYVGWMHEDQKLGLSEEEEYAEKNLRPMRR